MRVAAAKTAVASGFLSDFINIKNVTINNIKNESICPHNVELIRIAGLKR